MIEAVIVWIIVGVAAASAVVAGVWGLRQQTTSSARIIGMPATAPEAAFLGGMLSATVSVTFRLARLELFDWGIRLRASTKSLRFLPMAIPAWEARYGELAAVKCVSAAAGAGLGGVYRQW